MVMDLNSHKHISENSALNTNYKCSVRSSPKSVDFIHSAAFKDVTDYTLFRRKYPRSRHLPVRILSEWYIEVPDPNDPQICVVGLYKNMLIRTSPVRRTVGCRRIITNNCIYMLSDPSKVLENDVQNGLNKLFINGFPANWQSVLHEACGKEPTYISEEKQLAPLTYDKRDSLLHDTVSEKDEDKSVLESHLKDEGICHEEEIDLDILSADILGAKATAAEEESVEKTMVNKRSVSEERSQTEEVEEEGQNITSEIDHSQHNPVDENTEEIPTPSNKSIQDLLSSSEGNSTILSCPEKTQERVKAGRRSSYLPVSEAIKHSILSGKKRMRARRVSSSPPMEIQFQDTWMAKAEECLKEQEEEPECLDNRGAEGQPSTKIDQDNSPVHETANNEADFIRAEDPLPNEDAKDLLDTEKCELPVLNATEDKDCQSSNEQEMEDLELFLKNKGMVADPMATNNDIPGESPAAGNEDIRLEPKEPAGEISTEDSISSEKGNSEESAIAQIPAMDEVSEKAVNEGDNQISSIGSGKEDSLAHNTADGFIDKSIIQDEDEENLSEIKADLSLLDAEQSPDAATKKRPSIILKAAAPLEDKPDRTPTNKSKRKRSFICMPKKKKKTISSTLRKF